MNSKGFCPVTIIDAHSIISIVEDMTVYANIAVATRDRVLCSGELFTAEHIGILLCNHLYYTEIKYYTFCYDFHKNARASIAHTIIDIVLQSILWIWTYLSNLT